MRVKLPPLCPSWQGSGAKGCGVWAYSSFSSNYPPSPTEKDNFHGTIFGVFLVSFHWFGAASPAQLVLIFPPLQRAWLHLLGDLKVTGRLLLFSWLNKPCSSSLSSWGSTMPQLQSPWWAPLNSFFVHWRPKLDSAAHRWRMQMLQLWCFSFSPSIGIPGIGIPIEGEKGHTI